MLKAIVFDFDGVIVDSERLHYLAFLRVVEPLGVTFSWEEYLRTYIGFDDRDAFRVLLGDPPGGRAGEDRGRLAALIEAKSRALEAIAAEGLCEIPGARALIAEAHARLPIAIASGATRRDIDLMLGRLGLADRFSLIVSADVVRRSKPDPESYALAARQLAQRHPERGITPASCLAIEDTAAGIASARGAGLKVLGLATLGNPAALGQAHRVVPTLEGVTLDQLLVWFAERSDGSSEMQNKQG